MSAKERLLELLNQRVVLDEQIATTRLERSAEALANVRSFMLNTAPQSVQEDLEFLLESS